MKNDIKNIGNNVSKFAKKAQKDISKTAKTIKSKASDSIDKGKENVTKVLDQNGDGQVTIEDVIIMGLKVPGIADSVIQYERLCVSGISTALSIPGGIAMAATLPTDIAQYYGYMLRATQKLLYLYGFPEIDIEEAQLLDSATMNTLIICMGVMYGVAGANAALKSMAKALGLGVEKKLIHTALTKGTIYPIVKSVAKWFNVRLTKEVFAGFFKKSIPVVGGIIGGGITYVSFKPCCEKLKKTLQDTKLSNPNNKDDENIINIEEVKPTKMKKEDAE